MPPTNALAATRSSGAIAATTLALPTRSPARGPEPWAVELPDHAVAWRDGVVTFVGPAAELEGVEPERFEGCTIAPGFVDCHTHLPFVGWRADEFEARLSGVSYRELHGRGSGGSRSERERASGSPPAEGGIPRSARMLAEASDDEVLGFCRPLVREMADHGTTTLELKTGYGLSVEAELRQARLARRLAAEAPQTCTVTLLCHAVPGGVSSEDWVTTFCDELAPAAASEGLVDALDVYVEDIAFSLDDLARIAEAAERLGLPLRCHADQLGASGAAEAAVALGARSADHLNHVSDAGIAALGAASTVAVLLPTSTLFLRAGPPDVRRLIEAGAAIAIATDANPGTSPVVSMPQVIATACSLYGLRPLEALAAATVNAAAAVGLAPERGTLTVGGPADLVILEGEAFRQVPYRPGHQPVVHTFVGGERVGGR